MTFKGIELRFHPDERHFPVDVETALNRKDPCYTYQGKTKYQGTDYTYRHFRWYYTTNDGIGCCFNYPNSVAMGYHTHDLEGVTVLFNDANEPVHVYFHAHSYGEGTWRTWAECKKSDKGHLVVYSARYSHASYPDANLYGRIFGFASDVTSDKGRRTLYENFIDVDFKYTLDNDQIVKEAPTMDLPNKSITPLLRLLLPLSSKAIAKP